MPTVTAKNVIDDVWQNYAEAYATATAHSPNIPAEVNGLLTAALKAMSAGNYQEAKDIVGSATDLCYLVSITAVWSDLENAITAIKRECGQVPQSLESDFNTLKNRKRSLCKPSLDRMTPRHAPGEPKRVFEECAQLREKALSEFNLTRERARHIKRKGRWSIAKYVLAGPVMACLVGLFCSAYSKEIERIFAGLF